MLKFLTIKASYNIEERNGVSVNCRLLFHYSECFHRDGIIFYGTPLTVTLPFDELVV